MDYARDRNPAVAGEPVPAQIFLQPIASPVALGAFGFAITAFVIGAHMAGWFGTRGSQVFIAPYVLLFGGIIQLLAAMWAFKARDVLSTAVFGIWGAYWAAFGIQWMQFASGTMQLPINFTQIGGYGYWLIALAALTLSMAIAAFAVNIGTAAWLLLLTAGAVLWGISQFTNVTISGAPLGLEIVTGYFFMAAAVAAYYVGTALMLEWTFGRKILPVGDLQAEQVPVAVSDGEGEPGVVKHHHPSLNRPVTQA